MFETIGVLVRPYDKNKKGNIRIYRKVPGQVCVVQEYNVNDPSLLMLTAHWLVC